MTPATSNPKANPRPWHRQLLRLLGLAAACYLGVIIVLLVLENTLLFRPVRATEDWLSPPNKRVQDVAEEIFADGVRIHAWWCPTEGWEPSQGAVLYSHGNAGNLSHRGSNIVMWQKLMGQAVLIFDYPGYGRSDGKPSETGCYAAADAAYDWLTQVKQVPANRIILYGGSLGGAVATDLASRRPHRALVLMSAFTSVPDMAQTLYPWLPARWLVRNRFDNLEKIGRCAPPVYFAHGTRDTLVPFTQGQCLYDAAPEPKCFLRMEGLDHNDPHGVGFYTGLRRFLEEVEASSAPQAHVRVGGN